MLMENLKIFKIFKKESNSCKNCGLDCDESFSVFLEEQDMKNQMNFNLKNTMSNKMIYLSIFPLFYFLASILMMIVLILIKNKQKIILNSDVNINNMIFHSYYDLDLINPLIYKIYTFITTIAGMVIVITIFSIMHQRFKVPEYKTHSIKLYIMIIFGIVGNSITFIKGFMPLMHYDDLIQTINNELKIEISQLLFLIWIFFSVFFAIYSMNILKLLRSKQSMTLNNEENWYNYKILIIIYLNITTLIYVGFILHQNNILKFNLFQNFVEGNMNYVLLLFPYFIHTIHAILILSYYFELKYLNIALSQNLDVDYLFDDTEKKF